MAVAADVGKGFASMLKSRYGRIFLLIAALLLALIGYQIFNSWQSAGAAARTSVQNLTLTLERDLRTELDAAERMAATLAANIDPDAMHQASVGRHQTKVIRWLRSLAPDVSMVESLRVFDANGDLLYGSEDGTPRRNIAERPYFHKFQANPATPGMYYETVMSGLTGHALLLRVNAIRDAKGSFLGIASIAINLSALRDHFAKIDIGPGGAILLRRLDNGALVVRYPGAVEVDDKPAPDNDLRQAILQRGPTGTSNYISNHDGVSRVYGYRVLGANNPFFVAVGVAESHYLAQWRRDTALLAAVSLLLLSILALVFYRLARAEAQEKLRAGELRDSDDSLRNILQTTLDGFWRVDDQGRLLDVNPSYCHLSGYTREELIGMRISDLDATEDPIDTEARIDRLVKNGSDQFETQHRRKDGSIWHVEVSTTFREIGAGQIVAFLRDISERKRKDELLHTHQIELELQNEELKQAQLESDSARARYFDLYDMAPVGYCSISKKGLILQANLNTSTLLGVARDALIGQPFSQIILKEDQDIFYLNRKQIFESSEPRAFELRMMKHDGTLFWAHLAASAAKNADGASELRLALSDISERKQNEQHLERLLAEKETLLENQRTAYQQVSRFSQALEQTAESVVITNLTGGIEYVNEAYVKHSGYSHDELIGRNSRILQSGKTPRETYAALWGALSRGQTWRGEFRNRKKDGSEYIESAVISPVRQADGKITHYVGAKTDISLRKQAEEELRQAKEAAEAANVAKSRFLATMSHEIRTPMNGILGMAQVLLTSNISEMERFDYARIILGSGQTLLTLLNDILDLAKIESGKVEFESVALDPGQVVGETQRLFAEIARGKGLRIETDCSWERQCYVGDPNRLRQMLSNLVSNAIKFTAQGYVRIEGREVTRDAEAAMLEFSVTDSGVGIAKNEHPRLFQPFSQADSSITRGYGGSGLGLSIVASFARLMGGEVGLESEAGCGSRFWFRIRAGLAAVADSPAPRTTTGAANGPAETKGEQLSGRVLVVEDNPENRRVIEILLHKLGVSSAYAADGRDALDAITRGEASDLILMDVQMPRMDGYATTEAIRCWEKETGQPRRPIVALTADAFAENRRRCLAAGMDDVLTKPIAFDALKEMLCNWLPAGAPIADEFVAPPVAERPVDVARVAALVDELLPLLAQNQFAAIGHFRVLQETVAGTHLEAEINETGRLLQTMRFDLTLERLRRTVVVNGWDRTA